ncbi:hypothetical protein GOP47_0023650 [Adiantum capillus-veneris]|uniref:Histone deacetylase interacting domain-containing protein n=1 Tax=Adiantum capillus-veneris TaxID=13818 RepID=A0A9D4U4D2_ADICA|nr:hypothetical protein GOP47_0023650 [Adiantum capillus-veneris]
MGCANHPIRNKKRDAVHRGQLQSLSRKRDLRTSSLSKVQPWCKSVLNLDLSSSMTCTPSYRLLPIKYMRQASTLHPLRAAVLNDHWVCVPSDHQNFHLGRNKKSTYEKKLQDCEEDCCELDVLLESTRAAIRRMEVLFQRLSTGGDISLVDTYLTVLDWRCCNGITDECGANLEYTVRRDPSATLPLVIEKLKSKQEKLLAAQEGLFKSMKEAFLKEGASEVRVDTKCDSL